MTKALDMEFQLYTLCVNEERTRYQTLGVLLVWWLGGLRTAHNIPEDVGFIPGLTQWVEDLALPQVVA